MSRQKIRRILGKVETLLFGEEETFPAPERLDPELVMRVLDGRKLPPQITPFSSFHSPPGRF
jgi:hypothetical protein